MIWLLVQSAVILATTFTGGLWFGGAISAWTTRSIPAVPKPIVDDILPANFPNYHGANVVDAAHNFAVEADSTPDIVTESPPLADPIGFKVAPPPPTIEPDPPRWELLYPINQFGTLSETRSPV